MFDADLLNQHLLHDFAYKASYVKYEFFEYPKNDLLLSLKKINSISDKVKVRIDFKYGSFSFLYRKNQILAEYKIKL